MRGSDRTDLFARERLVAVGAWERGGPTRATRCSWHDPGSRRCVVLVRACVCAACDADAGLLLFGRSPESGGSARSPFLHSAPALSSVRALYPDKRLS